MDYHLYIVCVLLNNTSFGTGHNGTLSVYPLNMFYVACIYCAQEMVADLNSLSDSINRTRDTEDV